MADVSYLNSALYIGDGASPEVFTAMVDITGFSAIPAESRETIDTTTVANAIRTYIGGLRTGKPVTFDVKWDISEATHGASTGMLSKIQASGTGLNNFVVAIPAATPQYVAFSAVVTDISPAAALGDIFRASITLQPSGAATIGTSAPNTGS